MVTRVVRHGIQIGQGCEVRHPKGDSVRRSFPGLKELGPNHLKNRVQGLIRIQTLQRVVCRQKRHKALLGGESAGANLLRPRDHPAAHLDAIFIGKPEGWQNSALPNFPTRPRYQLPKPWGHRCCCSLRKHTRGQRPGGRHLVQSRLR